MKLMFHWNKKHWEQEKEISSKLQIKAFAKERSKKHRLDSQSDHLVANTRIKHGDRSCDLTLLKIYFLPIGEDSKYWIFTSLLLRSSQINSVRCSTHQLIVFKKTTLIVCVLKRLTFLWIWSATEPWLKDEHFLNITCIIILPAKQHHHLPLHHAMCCKSDQGSIHQCTDWNWRRSQPGWIQYTWRVRTRTRGIHQSYSSPFPTASLY